MGIERKLTAGVLNVAMHPHSPERYALLFRRAYRLRRPIQIRGDRYGLITALHREKKEEPDTIQPVSGDVFTFVDIDRSAPWFDISSEDFATEEDIESVHIPSNLKPNSARFSFVFYPDDHLLFYEGYFKGRKLSPNGATRFFSSLFRQPEVVERFGPVEVTHIPEHDAVEEALGLPRKQFIALYLKVPNPDDNDEAEREFLRRMQERNIRRQEETYRVDDKSVGIEMDDELSTRARIAANNGHIEVKGREADGTPVEVSTKDHPLLRTEYYDEAVEQAYQVLHRISSAIRATLRRG